MRDDDHGERIRFTDEEAAFLRHVRFGALPERVPPAERREAVETEPRRYWPEPVGDPETAALRMAGSG